MELIPKMIKSNTKNGTICKQAFTITLACLLIFSSSLAIFSRSVHADPSLDSLLGELNLTNLVSSNQETFPSGTYRVTFLAEFADYSHINSLSYYETGTEAFVVLFSGPEGAADPQGGYVQPPLAKVITVETEFGLSMLAQYRYFTEHWRNLDFPEEHAQVFRNLDAPTQMYIIVFEDLFQDSDEDFNDMVFSLEPIILPQIDFVTRSPENPSSLESVKVTSQVTKGMYDLSQVTLSYRIFGGSWTNVVMSKENSNYVANIPAHSDNTQITYKVTAEDSMGFSDVSSLYSFSVAVTVSSPIAVLNQSSEVSLTNEEVIFSATDSYDPDGVITSYFWDFGDSNNATGSEVTHTYAEDGEYTVTLRIIDNQGFTAITTALHTVNNRPPEAILIEPSSVIEINEKVTLDASPSNDPDGNITSYTWGFGDGTAATGEAVTHSYSDSGFFKVTLTVVDNDGATDDCIFLFNVLNNTEPASNNAPFALFSQNSSSINEGSSVHFDASDSYDSDGTIVDYLWNFGDGTTASGAIVDHKFDTEGVYSVTLTVTDNDAATSQSTTQIKVTNPSSSNQEPTASFTKSEETLTIGQNITFNASDSYDSDGTIVDFLWNFGDGTTASGPVVEHKFDAEGVYTVTLTVVDDKDASTSEFSEISVGTESDGFQSNLAILGIVIALILVLLLLGLVLRRKKRKR